ncbi:YTH domain-containing protein ECT4 [Rhodamnia argentea]|uniref:YTH domain-containing family protein n=1 Tax=Rhodamnia argentea TaxID=178133 RepID=A0A8B8PYP7_9MYRT|nr:YTH domain-containing protein ECT4 [Rhodamnia argentea]XP_030539920.1 YTH domain-containing protein ECT4 [Rhodamnia argentea]
MDMHNINEHGNAETYLIQNTETNQLIASPQFERVESMYNEGPPEFLVDQGMYYPTANYGYYCTGIGTPNDLEDHNRVFGIDGPDVQYTGVQSESLPYVYYSPSYGYAESPYNPYNPYIPGAMIGVEGPFVGAQQYYPLSPYHNSVSSPAYIPILVQPDVNSPEALSNPGAGTISRHDARGLKNNVGSASTTFSRNSTKNSSNPANSQNRPLEVTRENVGQGKPAVTYGSVSSASVSNSTSSRVFQGRTTSNTIQHVDNNFSGKVPSHRNQLKVGYSDFGSSAYGWGAVEKPRPRLHLGRVQENASGPLDAQGEQNRGPRTNRSKSQLAVRAYTAKAGDSNEQGIIIIDGDQYNKDDFSVDYEDAKFFVIKSYSEDDVHKSIKYSVWSSTPHGNKKLQSAYDDAQKIAAVRTKSCPIFLFFSVNASGQFCGVAEMLGPVDFHKDMDFWQQDKWSGSFPVKWHIIKDVQNTAFRHIILENNENKPVTNSRDTQEIMHKQGLEMLKIFKNHSLKTSLLDDFMYYENRQKMMQEERATLLVRSFHPTFAIPTLEAPRRLFNIVNEPQREGKVIEPKDLNIARKNPMSDTEQVFLNSNAGGSATNVRSDEQKWLEHKDDGISTLKIGSLTINPKQADQVSVGSASGAAKVETVQAEVLTVGSMPVKVNGFNESSSSLTVGTIPLDPRALLAEREGASKGSPQK